jgi:hypothetical protein
VVLAGRTAALNQSHRLRASPAGSRPLLSVACPPPCLRCGLRLTGRSSGPPTAWPASRSRLSSRLAGQAVSGPLSSNVRQRDTSSRSIAALRNRCPFSCRPHRTSSLLQQRRHTTARALASFCHSPRIAWSGCPSFGGQLTASCSREVGALAVFMALRFAQRRHFQVCEAPACGPCRHRWPAPASVKFSFFGALAGSVFGNPSSFTAVCASPPPASELLPPERCLTLRSSGPPTAWPAMRPRLSLRFAGQAVGGPLSSNVRHHQAPSDATPPLRLGPLALLHEGSVGIGLQGCLVRARSGAWALFG